MKIYRLEKEDGGGPFFTRDGYHRLDYRIKSNNNYLYGCSSILELNKWFFSRFSLEELNEEDYFLKIYDIPDQDIIIQNGEYCFPKTYLPIN